VFVTSTPPTSGCEARGGHDSSARPAVTGGYYY